MKPSFSMTFGLYLAGAALLTLGAAAWTYGQATRPKIPTGLVTAPKPTPPPSPIDGKVNPDAIGFPKKRLTVSVVDHTHNGNIVRDFGDCDAVLTFAADDVTGLSPDVKPSLVINEVRYPNHPLQRTPEKPVVSPGKEVTTYVLGSAGSYAVSPPLYLEVTWLPAIQSIMVTVPGKGAGGTYVLHADFIDPVSKTWYFGKAVFRVRAYG